MSSTADSSVRRGWRSGASEWGKSERVRGTVRRGICSAAARKRREWRALSWPGHGDGEVAAGGRSVLCGTAESGGGGRARRVGRFCKQEVAGLALHGSDGAEQRWRQEKQKGRLEVEEKGPVCNFQNFRDLTVNQR